MFSGQIVIPRGLIKWHKRKEKSADTFFNLEVSEDSVHGKGIIQVLDAKESGLDISKVMNKTCELQAEFSVQILLNHPLQWKQDIKKHFVLEENDFIYGF